MQLLVRIFLTNIG